MIGTASLSGTNITLANASNDFDTVTLSGAVVNLTDTDEVALATSTITSDFTLAAGGDVTQDTGASTLSVTGGVTSVTLTAGDITLDNAGNDFNEVTTTGATNVTLGDDNAIVLGANTVTTPTLNAGGAARTTAQTHWYHRLPRAGKMSLMTSTTTLPILV